MELENKNLCIKCREYPISNKFHKLCLVCNKKRLEENKPTKPKKIKPKNKKDLRLKKLKIKLLEQSEYTCQTCGVHAKVKPLTLSHTIPISLRPDLKYTEANMIIECMDCHMTWEHSSTEAKRKISNYHYRMNKLADHFEKL